MWCYHRALERFGARGHVSEESSEYRSHCGAWPARLLAGAASGVCCVWDGSVRDPPCRVVTAEGPFALQQPRSRVLLPRWSPALAVGPAPPQAQRPPSGKISCTPCPGGRDTQVLLLFLFLKPKEPDYPCSLFFTFGF